MRLAAAILLAAVVVAVTAPAASATECTPKGCTTSCRLNPDFPRDPALFYCNN